MLLSRRSLNRALLRRQLLLERSRIDTSEAIEHLVGLQAQTPHSPYIALWSRLADFDPERLSALMEDRKVVRAHLMRMTIHLLTAGDCLALRPLFQEMMIRRLAGTPFGRNTAGLDLQQLLDHARRLLEEQPRNRAELGRLLGKRWPKRETESLAYAVSYLFPLVQIPPRGLWGRTGRPTWATAEAWLGRRLDENPDPDELLLRYLSAFGPASVADAQAWSGLNGLRDVADRLRPRLRTFRDERGRELLDAPDTPMPDADTPAPVRFLPDYDNVLLGHADRSRIFGDRHHRSLIGRPTVLVDGFVAASWKAVRGKKRAGALVVEPIEKLQKKHHDAIEEEGRRLLELLFPDAGSADVRIETAGNVGTR